MTLKVTLRVHLYMLLLIIYFLDFDVLFNPDILVSGINHADSAEVLQKDKQNVYELSTYLTKTVIPKFVSLMHTI